MSAHLFHFSHMEFSPGDILTPAQERGGSAWEGHFGYRGDMVYVFGEDAIHAMDLDPPWSTYLYEVEALGPVEQDPEHEIAPNDISGDSWITPTARVLKSIDIAPTEDA